LAHVAGEQSGIDVVAAADAVADIEVDVLALVEIGRTLRGRAAGERQYGPQRAPINRNPHEGGSSLGPRWMMRAVIAFAGTRGYHERDSLETHGALGMTGLYEQTPGIGHNLPREGEEEEKHQRWDRWAKKRTFVRSLEGTYSHLYKQLVEAP